MAQRLQVFLKRALISLLMMLSLGTIVSLPLLHAESASTEYRVKAAFLYNFAKFIEWPSGTFQGTGGSLLLCIIGTNPFGDAFEPFHNKMLKGQHLAVHRLFSLEDADVCHIVYVSDSSGNSIHKIISQLNGLPVLTVSDIDNFAVEGGMINLITMNNKVGFRVNLKSAERSRLTISSKLLNLAETVYEN